jgi:F0F1-type ATP synthase delta subunit
MQQHIGVSTFFDKRNDLIEVLRNRLGVTVLNHQVKVLYAIFEVLSTLMSCYDDPIYLHFSEVI